MYYNLSSLAPVYVQNLHLTFNYKTQKSLMRRVHTMLKLFLPFLRLQRLTSNFCHGHRNFARHIKCIFNAETKSAWCFLTINIFCGNFVHQDCIASLISLINRSIVIRNWSLPFKHLMSLIKCFSNTDIIALLSACHQCWMVGTNIYSRCCCCDVRISWIIERNTWSSESVIKIPYKLVTTNNNGW